MINIVMGVRWTLDIRHTAMYDRYLGLICLFSVTPRWRLRWTNVLKVPYFLLKCGTLKTTKTHERIFPERDKRHVQGVARRMVRAANRQTAGLGAEGESDITCWYYYSRLGVRCVYIILLIDMAIWNLSQIGLVIVACWSKQVYWLFYTEVKTYCPFQANCVHRKVCHLAFLKI